MLDPALNVAEVTRSAASQHTSLLPMSAARMLNNYDDKMPRANLEPNSIDRAPGGVGGCRLCRPSLFQQGVVGAFA